MFSKIDKKVLITLIIVLAVILLVSFFAYKYFKEIKITVEDSAGGANIEAPEIEIEPQPGLFICADKCGDGLCQTSDPECKDNMNCVCPETKEECPEDCK
ncbi:MAG: hypothetical protein CEN87_468 [Parcubacteria group bacterium Licking1014_1]|nr:MAG: hypothetical protein CEN87_468 [Parcubacteria group bacterium Licking1014_1]